ncbi:MAG TPA: hypothetical protein VM287_06255 [Egibacteraceae bacterium]|nr:hypothetical protein [Egibacteraceae bacterium]
MRARWLLVGLVFLCAACELRMEVEAAFDRGGGGRLHVALTADGELVERARAAGATPLDDLVATGQELGGGWRVDDTIDDEGGREVRLSVGFGGPEEFNRLAGEVSEALAAPELELLGPLEAHLTDDRLVVEGTAALQPTEQVAELGLTPQEAVTLLRDEGAFIYEIHVAAPGEVLETTGEQRGEDVLTWTVAPGEQVDIRAVAQRPGRPVWPLAVGGVAGVLFAALVLRRALVIRRR